MRRMGTDPAFASIQQMLFEGRCTEMYQYLLISFEAGLLSLPCCQDIMLAE